MSGEAQYRAALEGRFESALSEAEALDRWTVAARNLWALSSADTPGLTPFEPQDPTPAGAAVALVASLDSFLRLDTESARLVAQTDWGSVDPFIGAIVGAFFDLVAPDRNVDVEALAASENEAARAERAFEVVVLAALRALGELKAARAAEATRHARRAARMARTEALPHAEYLANYALIKARRYGGTPYLSVRIADSLLRVAPASWRRRLGLELLWAMGPSAPERFAWLRDDPVIRGVHDFLSATRGGDRTAALASAAAVERQCQAVGPSLRAAAACLGYDVDPDPVMAPWLVGSQTTVPYGLSGLRDEFVAYMILGTPSRRVLGLARNLHGDVQQSSRPGRVETALAVLGEGRAVARPDFFERVFGFAFEADIHRGSLEVLIHRMRQFLGDAGEIERVDERIQLRMHKPLVIPDPRCEATSSDQLLSVLAQSGCRSAREAAKAAGIPLRTAQAALRELVAQGACATRKRGRTVEYLIEDTTFSEPTQTGR